MIVLLETRCVDDDVLQKGKDVSENYAGFPASWAPVAFRGVLSLRCQHFEYYVARTTFQSFTCLICPYVKRLGIPIEYF